jgi:hypothetical protein
MRTIGVLLLVAAAIMTLRHMDRSGPGNPATAAAETAAAAGASVASSAAARTGGVIGTAASGIIRPAVTGMTEKTAASVAGLEPAIKKASPHRAARARDIAKQIAATDSAAHRSLDQGRPIAAMRLALKGRSLVDAVRHQVAEERLR